MQKIFIIFAVIILSFTTQAQMKVRNLQLIADDPKDDSTRIAPKPDSIKSTNFVELNNLGVRKVLVEKDYKQAIEFFSKAVEIAPACFRCKFNLGRSFMELENFDEAIKQLRNQGAPFAAEPFETPCCHMAVVQDPDGNKLIIHKLKPESEKGVCK